MIYDHINMNKIRYYPPEDHKLDIYPVPKDKTPMFINEPWLTDPSYDWLDAWGNEPEDEADNIRVYMMRCVINYTSKMHFSPKRLII